MANYKRKRARTSTGRQNRGSQASWRARNNLKPVHIRREDWDSVHWHTLWPQDRSMMSSWPRWWDIVFHTRPKRREQSRLLHKVMQGHDPDAIAWPVNSRKPHNYYW